MVDESGCIATYHKKLVIACPSQVSYVILHSQVGSVQHNLKAFDMIQGSTNVHNLLVANSREICIRHLFFGVRCPNK